MSNYYQNLYEKELSRNSELYTKLSDANNRIIFLEGELQIYKDRTSNLEDTVEYLSNVVDDYRERNNM